MITTTCYKCKEQTSALDCVTLIKVIHEDFAMTGIVLCKTCRFEMDVEMKKAASDFLSIRNIRNIEEFGVSMTRRESGKRVIYNDWGETIDIGPALVAWEKYKNSQSGEEEE